jgi:3-oxoisoapionate kinase
VLQRLTRDAQSKEPAREQIIGKAVEGLSLGLNAMLSTAPESGDAPEFSILWRIAAPRSSMPFSNAVASAVPQSQAAIHRARSSENPGFRGLGYHGWISNGVAVSLARSDDRHRNNMLVMLKDEQMGHEQLFETFLEKDAVW